MTPGAARDRVRELLHGLNDPQVHAACVEALRNWRERLQQSRLREAFPIVDVFQMHGDLGRAVIPLLARGKNEVVSAEDIHMMKEVFIDSMHQDWMKGVAEFVWWFIRAGFATEPRRSPQIRPLLDG